MVGRWSAQFVYTYYTKRLPDSLKSRQGRYQRKWRSRASLHGFSTAMPYYANRRFGGKMKNKGKRK